MSDLIRRLLALTVDYDGSQMDDREPPRGDLLTCALLREAVAALSPQAADGGLVRREDAAKVLDERERVAHAKLMEQAPGGAMAKKWYHIANEASACAAAIRALPSAESAEGSDAEDARRLDWMERNCQCASIAQEFGTGAIKGPHIFIGGDARDEANHFYGSTYREAIDAATKAGPK